jgi:PBSX family phage terminase large subunit
VTEFSPHSSKQDRIIFSDAKLLVAATGLQFGKSLAGAMWMKLMMHEHSDPSDSFIIASPSFPILRQSTLPPFLEIMQGLGTYNKQENSFRMHGAGICYFRTGVDPHSVVGITNVRAILCDEAGLYSLYFWNQIVMRASFKQAPIRIVTTPYSRNWLWKDYVKPHLKEPGCIPGLELVQATSRENPYFPEEEFELRKRTMDARRFNMFYCAEFEQMIGLVYDCFHYDENISKVQTLPDSTRYVAGVDFGTTVPFALVVRGITPSGHHYEINEFYKSGMVLSEMIEVCKQFQRMHGIEKFYCDPSAPGYIEEFCRAGLRAEPANNDIDVGIAAHYELIQTRRYQVFEGKCPHMLDELDSYHYADPRDVKPDQDEKAPKPVKQNDHAMDAVRYLSIMTYKGFTTAKPFVPKEKNKLTGMAYDRSIFSNRSKKTEVM